jgi:hypothetical protein
LLALRLALAADWHAPPGDGSGLRYGSHVASPQTLTTPQRLAAIREQMSLLTDYL